MPGAVLAGWGGWETDGFGYAKEGVEGRRQEGRERREGGKEAPGTVNATVTGLSVEVISEFTRES